MKKLLLTVIYCFAACISKAQISSALKMPELGLPWKNTELLEPGDLAVAIKANKAPTILNIGAVEDLPGAKHIGAVSDAETLKKLKETISTLPKGKTVVIYCGCCPFSKCPNIKPAYVLLKENGFTAIRVLDLPTNLKTDWLSKGYPVAAAKK